MLALWLARFWLPPSLRTLLHKASPYQSWLRVNGWTPAARADLVACLSAQERGQAGPQGQAGSQRQAGSQGRSAGQRLPTFSIVMPVHRPDRQHWHSAIASIRAQVHEQWQLCLCDDGSQDPALSAELADLAARDPRIVVTALPVNGGISAATNAAAALATGEILLFMDQDDLLTPDCLGMFALTFAADPTLDLVYSDSDKIDADGTRHSPMFKPGWSPTLLLGYMYLSHAVALRREVFERLGGLRSGFDGSQDHDLALRAGEVARNVGHIPRVLYHWRVAPGSTALAAGQKPASIGAGARAVEAALVRRGITAQVHRPDWAQAADLGLFALRFEPSAERASVIFVGKDGSTAEVARIAALRAELPDTAEVIVALAPGSAPLDLPGVRSLRAAQGQSLGARLRAAADVARRDRVVVVSAGLAGIEPDLIDQLCGHLQLPGVGLVAPRVLAADGRVAGAGLIWPAGATAWEHAFAGLRADRAGTMYLARVARECAAVSGECFAMAREQLLACSDFGDSVGGYLGIGLALSAAVRRAGRSVLICAGSSVRQSGDVAAPPVATDRSAGPWAAGDPWYNRNLGSGAGKQFLPAARAPAVMAARPLRLVVVMHNLDREGAQISALDLVDGLIERGLAVPLVISPRDGELAVHLRARGVAVQITPDCGRRPGLAALTAYRARLGEIFLEFGADVVLANTLETHAAVAAAAEAGIGVVWWQHEGGAWQRYFRHVQAPVRARAYTAFGQAYRVVQVARATSRAWLPLARQGNFEAIRLGVSPNWLRSATVRWDRAGARHELGLTRDDIVVLAMGSVCRRKGQLDIVAMMGTLPAEVAARLRVFVVGGLVEPRYHADLLARQQALPADLRDRIHYSGNVSDPALYYAAADIFLCCSRQESAPRVLAEAQVFDLPIVTTPVDGIPEVVRQGVNAVFYTPGDIPTLASHITWLATSPASRKRLGRTGRGVEAQIRDYEQMLDRFDALLREAAWTSSADCRPTDDEARPVEIRPVRPPSGDGADLPSIPAAAA